MSPALHINDQNTISLVERLVAETGQTRTAVVLAALDHYAEEKFPHLKQAPAHSEPLATREAQEAELERVLRAVTLDYQRLRAQHQNKRSVGSRVYKMIADNGVVGTLEKLIERPTEGLEFLAREEKLHLAAETIVLDKRFSLVISDEMRSKASRNLAMIDAAIAHGKKFPVQATNDSTHKTDALRRVCPECQHVFQGSGWGGIDAHWRANHENVMRFEKAWPFIKAGQYKQAK